MTSTMLPPDAVGFVCDLVRQRSAIELDAAKTYLIEARLDSVAKKHGFSSTLEMLRQLQAGLRREVLQYVVEAMTTNETSFFRDAYPFESLRRSVIPELIRLRGRERSLTIWSAACSTGQEAYSIAMLLREHFPELQGWKVSIIGTDLCDAVLEKARAAKYSQVEINRGLSAAQLDRHFRREGLLWEVAPELKSMVSFSKLNLIEAWPATIPTIDVVFLRNVLIYFSTPIKKAILQKIRVRMAPHSVLFLGAAETMMNLEIEYERIQDGASVYYRMK